MIAINGKRIALSLVLLAAAPLAFAQSESGQEFTDDTLASYAEARAEVREIGRSYQQEMQDADNRKDAQQMQQEMRDEMVQAVEDSGISVQEYNTITEQASQDRELRSRIADNAQN